MKLLIIFLVLMVHLSLLPSKAKTSNDMLAVKISDTSTVTWPQDKNWIYEPLLHSDGLVVSSVEKTSDLIIVIQRAKPLGLTNKKSVEREWNKLNKDSNNFIMKNNNKCIEHNTLYFSCSRLIFLEEENIFVFEKFVWHEMSDLIVIQLRSKNKFLAKRESRNIELSFISKKVVKK